RAAFGAGLPGVGRDCGAPVLTPGILHRTARRGLAPGSTAAARHEGAHLPCADEEPAQEGEMAAALASPAAHGRSRRGAPGAQDVVREAVRDEGVRRGEVLRVEGALADPVASLEGRA